MNKNLKILCTILMSLGWLHAAPTVTLMEKITNRTLESLAQYFKLPKTAIQVDIIHPPKLNNTDDNCNRFEIKIKNPDFRLGYQTLWVVYTDALGKRIQRPMSVDIRIEAPAWVATMTIPRGAVLTSEIVSLEKIKIDRGHYKAPQDSAKILGLVARQLIRENSVIRSDMLKEPPYVQRGDEVTITLSKGALQIDMTGIIQNEARIGDEVSVITKGTGKKANGLLIARDRVEIR
jgi:flagella basal body P-ring formation protein FlgA